jgi:serine protease Do
VIVMGWGSQAGPPLLRDAAGTVYEIGQVLACSDREDFVIFSLRSPPSNVQPLTAGPPPALDDPVYSVGNALSQGVVILGGVHTADTPETQDGEWKWLRFTGADAPGNSGGPLLDASGRVIGVTLGRPQQENLNYALPISHVLEAKPEGHIANRNPFRLPLLNASEMITIDARLPMPMPLAAFYHSFISITEAGFDRGWTQLLQHNAQRVFPNGPGSEALLHRVQYQPLPVVMLEGPDGSWMLQAGSPQSVWLDHKGILETNAGFFRMRAPEDLPAASLSTSSKTFMDLLLKGRPLYRRIGGESVRVLSLGKATQESRYPDAYGRVWQLRTWPVPFDDAAIAVFTLATPEGVAGLLVQGQKGMADLLIDEPRRLLDFVFVTMQGSLTQWQAYLAQKSLQPPVFSTLAIDIEPGQRVRVRTPRVDFDVTPPLLNLSGRSFLRLNFSFYREGGHVVWDVGGAAVGEEEYAHHWVNFQRRTEPPANLPENFQNDWRQIVNLEHPYDSVSYVDNVQTYILTGVAGGAAAPELRYALGVVGNPDQQQEFMSAKLKLLQQSFKVLPR